MNFRTALRRTLGLGFLIAGFFAGAAHAQLFRAYVASTGSDANPCTLQQPCRLLPEALAAVTNGGEIWMLDSANYNTGKVVVGKSVSILAAPGAMGSLITLSEPAVEITASGLDVSLRNLVITGFPGTTPATAVQMTGGSTLTIDRGLIAGVGDGVVVEGSGRLRVVDSVIRDVSGVGISLASGATGHVSRTRVLDTETGIAALSFDATTTAVTATDSVVSGAINQGFYASGASNGALARISVNRCTVDGNGFAGLRTTSNNNGTALIALGNSMVTGNGYAWYIEGGAIRTYGNNQVDDNANGEGGSAQPGTLK